MPMPRYTGMGRLGIEVVRLDVGLRPDAMESERTRQMVSRRVVGPVGLGSNLEICRNSDRL